MNYSREMLYGIAIGPRPGDRKWLEEVGVFKGWLEGLLDRVLEDVLS